MEFESFGKIPRLLKLPMIITEKIDGTNAQIVITQYKDVSHEFWEEFNLVEDQHIDGYDLAIFAGSRKCWINLKNDNFGFANWVSQNWKEVIKLGLGKHYGEWWGKGIQRGYDLKEKKFSLFNVSKWSRPEDRPACCDVVPVLYAGDFSSEKIKSVKDELLKTGSHAASGYMNPEGVVIYLPKANLLFKAPYKEGPKGEE